ncbi:MAG: M14 family metallopeptidase [Chloroflexota bacterium]
MPHRLVTLIALILALAACAPTPAAPTVTPTATETPRQLATRRPTQTPRAIATWTASPAPPTATPSITPIPPTPLVVTRPPTITPTPDDSLVIGQSAGGRDIVGHQIGNGPRVILLVGGVHAGTERNTVELMNGLLEHFRANRDDIAPDFSLMIIPAMNPDGLAATGVAGRFNANGVDLNRNWSCGWQPDARWSGGPVDPGARPFSELETQAVAALIGRLAPEVALFYHSAADGVFPGDCPLRGTEWRGGQLAAVYGNAADYSFGSAFTAYPVTGTAPSWVDGMGIPSLDVELSSASDPQFARNLRAVLAVQCWLQGPECDRTQSE